MSMTAKDYETLARLICQHLDNSWNTDPVAAVAVENFGIDLAEVLAKDNPRFDKARFFKACNIEVAV